MRILSNNGLSVMAWVFAEPMRLTSAREGELHDGVNEEEEEAVAKSLVDGWPRGGQEAERAMTWMDLEGWVTPNRANDAGGRIFRDVLAKDLMLVYDLSVRRLIWCSWMRMIKTQRSRVDGGWW